MPRRARVAPGGMVYHVLNRAAGRGRLFRNDDDFAAFERLIAEALQRHPIRLLSWCLMRNHWHFIAWPGRDGELSQFFRWLTHTHAMRWRTFRRSVGEGPVYQGRFKSFMIQQDEHLLTACRYVERNALTAGLVRRAEAWRWSSLWVRRNGDEEHKALLHEWPVDRPRDWVRTVNQPLSAKEIERLELSECRSRPFGEDGWVARTARQHGLEHTIRPEGRPRKGPEKN